MDKLREKLRDEETARILELLKGLDHKGQEIYLRAYADGLNYVGRILKPEENDTIQDYLP